MIESTFWLAFVCVASVSGLLGVDATVDFTLVIVCAIGRLALYVTFSSKAELAYKIAIFESVDRERRYDVRTPRIAGLDYVTA